MSKKKKYNKKRKKYYSAKPVTAVAVNNTEATESEAVLNDEIAEEDLVEEIINFEGGITSDELVDLDEFGTDPEEEKSFADDETVLAASEEIDSKDNDEPETEKKENFLKPALMYFLFYLGAFIYWEVFMRLQISGSLETSNLGLFFFIPSEALLLAGFAGVHKRHPLINRIAIVVLTLITAVYYGVQFIYFRIFGSLISVSMLGMGTEAVGNFGWALKGVVLGSIGYIGLILLPVLVAAILAFAKLPVKEAEGKTEERRTLFGNGYYRWLHLAMVAAAVLTWWGATYGLRILGTDRDSAYYVMNDAFADTDTTAQRIGTLATSVVEGGSYYFGLGSSGELSVVAVNQDALDLENMTDKSETNTEEEVEEVVEEDPVVIVPHVNENIDFAALSENTNDANIKALCDYFGSKKPTETNEYTGLFEGYNLIYICGEAFSNWGIDPDITPMLYEMSTNGIVLTNYYNSFPNTTTNGEYAFATSYWPDVSRIADSGTVAGSFAQSASTFMPYGLGDLFSAEGTKTYGFHNYYGNYYWRDHSWPNLGYENLKFMGAGMEFTTSWPASDLEMFEQSIDDYINDDTFHAYYMTFSGHGPYNSDNRMYKKNIEAVKELAGDKYTDNAILGYFCGEYELELGLEYLVERLKEAGKLDNTVIVLAGDHFPYFLPESAKQEFNGGEPMDASFEQFHSTCIIYNAGLKEPIVNENYCCNVDILPTILNLFNIDYDSRILMGTDVFSNGLHRARLYNGSFITNTVKYDKKTGNKIWSDSVSSYSEELLKNHFDAMVDYTESEYTASLQALKNNFWFYVWKNSGLLTEEEIEAEVQRENSYQYDYDTEAQAEAEKAALEAQQRAEQEALEAQQAEGGEQVQGENPQPEANPENPNP